MGTRADFYVGSLIRLDEKRLALGELEWLGSKGYDGAPASPRWNAISHELLGRRRERTWREAVAKLLKRAKDTTLPEQGWPWPWESSENTDWVYIFDPTINQVHLINFKDYAGTWSQYDAYSREYEAWSERIEAAKIDCTYEAWQAWQEENDDWAPDRPSYGQVVSFPNMKETQNVATGTRSGVPVVRV